jgi:hypothetical protein
MQLSRSLASSQALDDLSAKLADLDPTALQEAFGLDKARLEKLIADAKAAEKEYQEAFRKWEAALRAEAGVPADEGTCIQRRQSRIAEAIYAGPKA